MKTAALSLIAATLLGASATTAQSSGFYTSGVVSVDYVNSTATRTMGYVDFTFGLAPEASGAGIGFEAGVWGFGGTGMPTTRLGFAAATFALGGGRLHVGAPRTGAAGFNTQPVITGAQSALAEVGIVTGQLPYSYALAATAGNPIVGVRYERNGDRLAYAGSLGQFRSGADRIGVLSLGAAGDLNGTRVFGTLEHFWAPGGSVTTAVLGASHRFALASPNLNAVEVGGSVMAIRNGGGSTQTSTSAYVTADINGRLAVTGSALRTGSTTLLAVNASYDVWNGVILNAGVGRVSGGSNLWTLGLSRRF